MLITYQKCTVLIPMGLSHDFFQKLSFASVVAFVLWNRFDACITFRCIVAGVAAGLLLYCLPKMGAALCMKRAPKNADIFKKKQKSSDPN